jgi:hypothetical protein
MTAELVETLRILREDLAAVGVSYGPIPQTVQDQCQSSFRHDLAANGVRPKTSEELEAAVVGFACAVRPMVQQAVPISIVGQFVQLCECLVPMLDAPIVDYDDFPDVGFLDEIELQPEPELSTPMCTNCEENPGFIQLPNGSIWCQGCILRGMAVGRAMIMTSMPQVGGPGFERDEPVADVGPKHRWLGWMDLTVNELFSKIWRRHGKEG